VMVPSGLSIDIEDCAARHGADWEGPLGRYWFDLPPALWEIMRGRWQPEE